MADGRADGAPGDRARSCRTVPAGHTRNGLPYNRFGSGPRTPVVFQGLLFENKPLSGLDARFAHGMYLWLEPAYTVYVVTRRRGLPLGCTLARMSADYAEMIAEELDGPVDVIGTSTGECSRCSSERITANWFASW